MAKQELDSSKLSVGTVSSSLLAAIRRTRDLPDLLQVVLRSKACEL